MQYIFVEWSTPHSASQIKMWFSSDERVGSEPKTDYKVTWKEHATCARETKMLSVGMLFSCPET
jgi:hypothetical protein